MFHSAEGLLKICSVQKFLKVVVLELPKIYFVLHHSLLSCSMKTYLLIKFVVSHKKELMHTLDLYYN